MSNRRGRRGRRLTALTLIGAFALTGCVMQPQMRAPTSQPSSASEQRHESSADDAAEDETRFPAAPQRSTEPVPPGEPDHGETPPPHQPQPIWHDGAAEFPQMLGGYTLTGESARLSESMTRLYTGPDYRILTVTIAQQYRGYNARLDTYDDLRLVGSAVCGTDSRHANDIAWRTCFMVAADGFVSITAYSAADISTAELAHLTERLYSTLIER